MKVHELINELQKIEDKSIEIVLHTDHGQTPMKLMGVTVERVYDITEYMMDFFL